jgi:4-amino-4-deoxy-L-arabinose transferase-like glycosyltransferase
LLIAASLGVAAFTLWWEAETEPYHIDELRQVRPYSRSFDVLVDRSFSQEQPPLDVLVGAGFQRVLGVGDVLQRGHSMLAGLLALAHGYPEFLNLAAVSDRQRVEPSHAYPRLRRHAMS